MNSIKTNTQKLPDWFRQRLPADRSSEKVLKVLDSLNLNTVCESADCPNRTSCYGCDTATFMILGKTCTRNCTFCAVDKGIPSAPDKDEPFKIAEAVQALEMKYAVITSVTRDDLPDGGDGHFAMTVKAIRERSPGALVELLIPDIENPEKILETGPEVIGHNLETVPRLYKHLRPMAAYKKSLGVLSNIKRSSPETLTKSGIMLGLGETEREITETMEDLLNAGCDIMTMGQYLRPSKSHFPVNEYVHPDVFERLGEKARSMGFKAAASSPLVRSSYMAHEIFRGIKHE